MKVGRYLKRVDIRADLIIVIYNHYRKEGQSRMLSKFQLLSKNCLFIKQTRKQVS